jgi:Na+-translocating ferredoxin:NAD+ oxidoreductase subunit C
MTTQTSEFPGKGDFARGVHPNDSKAFSADMPIQTMPAPSKVVLPLQQHVGAPCEPVEGAAMPKMAVAMGDVVASSEAFVSAPIHSPINGTTTMMAVTTLPNGRHVKAVAIQAGEGEQLEGDALIAEVFGGDWPTDGFTQTPDDIVAAVRGAGVVGLGGAAFPTHVKLKANPDTPIDTILVNGCECEPYLTADYRVMLEHPAPVITGALLAARAVGAENVVIAIEDNKPMAIEAMQRAARGTNVVIAAVHTRYPMGGEKQTIKAVLDRTVPTGGLPLNVGAVVCNVGTCAAIARAVLKGKPLTHRIISVTGEGVGHPRNLLAPIGISYGELIEQCGGLKANAARVVAGGPMMGFTLTDLTTPVTKGTSGITVLIDDDLHPSKETPCVRCGQCVDVCPLNLVPTKIAHAARHKAWDVAKRHHMAACMECGCCAFTCPAQIPLIQLIRMGKVQMPRE